MAAAKKELTKEEYRELRDTVYTFFYYSNKPVNISELTTQFKNITKPRIEKILEDLVEKKKIFSKALGKQKYYCLVQDMTYTIDDPEYTDAVDAQQNQTVCDKELRFLRWKRANLLQTLKTLQLECSQLDEMIKVKEQELGTEDLIKAIEGMRAFIKKNGQVKELKLVSEADAEKQNVNMNRLRKELQQRKRMLKEMIDMLCDGLDLKRSELLSEAGIEG